MKMQEVGGPAHDDAQVESLPQSVRLMMYVAGLLLAAFVIFVIVNQEGKSEAEKFREWVDSERQPEGDDHHMALRFVWDEEFNSQNPKMEPLPDGDLPAVQVIGVEVDGVAHAFTLNDKAKDQTTTIQTKIAGMPLAIIHNYVHKTTRVLTSSTGDVVPVKRGGLQDNFQFAVLHEGVRYVLDSDKIPLDDYRFEITSLAEWAKAHPDTLVHYTPNYELAE
ncbi:MAG TPA: hypothetical protein DDW52_10750 [Planctomycetaceae bacterium]|nr:hypothetical protein [Planctomycetaceae bacterium]